MRNRFKEANRVLMFVLIYLIVGNLFAGLITWGRVFHFEHYAPLNWIGYTIYNALLVFWAIRMALEPQEW